MAPDKRRLFFALWPEEPVRERLDNLRREAVGDGPGRPVARDKLHLTLCFLGGVDAGTAVCLEQAAGRVAVPPFTLTFDSLGHWARPQVLWLGAGETPEELSELVRQLRRAQADCGLKPEGRPFQAHLTLARKVRRRPSLPEVAPVHWPVSDFALVASETLPEGARYEVVGRWPLRETD